jgi:hypothetical protein
VDAGPSFTSPINTAVSDGVKSSAVASSLSLRRSLLNMTRSSRAATTEDSLICLTIDSLDCAVTTEQLELLRFIIRTGEHWSRVIADLAGVLLLDSVDVNNTVPTALQKLTGVNYRPVLDISSERYVWNMYAG